MEINKKVWRVEGDYCTFCHEEGGHKDDCIMDMPCNCPDCGVLVDLNDMHHVEPWKLSNHNMVCDDCYENLESDDE